MALGFSILPAQDLGLPKPRPIPPTVATAVLTRRWPVDTILLFHEMLVELPHVSRNEGWQRGLKEGRAAPTCWHNSHWGHPLAGVIGSGKKLSLCVCGVRVCRLVGRGQKWRALAWADVSNMINWL